MAAWNTNNIFEPFGDTQPESKMPALNELLGV